MKFIFKGSIYNKNNGKISRNLRLIDFKRENGLGSPHIYTMNDIEELKETSNLFTRKFDKNIDSKIIDSIYESKGKEE